MKTSLKIYFLLISFLISSCGIGDKFNNTEGASSPKKVVVEFNASKETAVKTRGGYKVYIGTVTGFSLGDALRVIDISGDQEDLGKIKVEVPDLDKGQYYIKLQSYSDLINPTTSLAATSETSDEVSFYVP